jgi:hypothetical protein
LKVSKFAGLVLALTLPVASAQAGQSVSLILNWTPAADHSFTSKLLDPGVKMDASKVSQ